MSLPTWILLGGLTFALASCSGRNPEMATSTPDPTESASDDQITLSREQFDYAGIGLGKIEMQEFHDVVKSTGMLDIPPGNQVAVHAYYGGYIRKIDLLPGEKVRQGQVLFVLENPDYIPIQQDFLELKSQMAYLKSDFERQQSLAADKVASQKTLLKAESDYQTALARFASLQRQLELMNIDADQLQPDKLVTTMNVYAPISGHVTEVNIVRGDFLNPSETALRLINTDHIHVELNVFERDLPRLAIGQPIRFSTQDDPAVSYDAYVHLINKKVDPETRMVNLHGHMTEDQHAAWFSPGMYVEAEIFTSSLQKPALPQDAVVELDGTFYVLLREKSNGEGFSFSIQVVEPGALYKGYREIKNAADFTPDAEFMIKGAFDLIAE